jgi:AcrR family transcriptional regulator
MQYLHTKKKWVLHRMATNLRERRRRQTAREIQMAALVVTLSLGYEHTTTEAIAAEAGISTRTFFNYYNNKQAAILGEAPRLSGVEAGWFIASQRPIVDDIILLLGAVLEDDQLDRRILRKIFAVVEAAPEMLPLFRQTMDDITSVLTELL